MLRASMLAAIAVWAPLFGALHGSGAALEAAELPGGAGRGEPTWLSPDGDPLPFTDAEEIREFLAKAEVLDSWPIPTGTTQPLKLLLERDGVRAHAVFHDVDIELPRAKLGSGKTMYLFRDHYINNVAAFELSRRLGMTSVPPVVVRRINRKEGSVQLWIENAITETERQRQRVVPAGEWRLAVRDMEIFDNLANNIDRNQGNILFDGNWNLWFIDHTRAFGGNRELPSPERVKRCSRRLWQALRELGEAEVRRVLQPHLRKHEIVGLLHRHKRLLRLIEERIAAQGEDAVLFSYGETAPPVVARPEGQLDADGRRIY